MAIAAQRFKFLDNETNVPITDFNEIVDNLNLNVAAIQTELESLPEKVDEAMAKLSEKLTELQSIEIPSIDLEQALNSAIKSIENIELPEIAKTALRKLRELNLDGVKGFFKDILGVGKALLCANLDFLKLFLLGISLNPNILSGLLIALFLSWLDRLCSGYNTPEVREKEDPKIIFDTLMPYEPKHEPSTMFTSFKQYYADLMDRAKPLTNLGILEIERQQLVLNIPNLPSIQEVQNTIRNLATRELTTEIRETIDFSITERLRDHLPTSPQYRNLLVARGELSKLPSVSPIRTVKQNQYEYLNDKAGGFLLTLEKQDFTTEPLLTGTDASLASKLRAIQENLRRNKPLAGRNTSTGSFDDLDLITFFPQDLSPEERAAIQQRENESNSYMWRDVSPTTGEFLWTRV